MHHCNETFCLVGAFNNQEQLFTSMQKEKASHATLLTGNLLAALLAI
jgi:hypothetical protein